MGVFNLRTAVQVPLQLLSDVQRVAYFVGPELPPGESGLSSGELPRWNYKRHKSMDRPASMLSFALQQQHSTLNLSSATLLQTGEVPQTDENGNPVYVDIATLVAGLASFDLKYFDRETETWNSSWDDTESVPSAVQILITVQGEPGSPPVTGRGQQSVSTDTTQLAMQGQPVTPSNSMTQSTMVYLPASATAGGAP